MANISAIYLHLCIKNIKPIYGELTELQQFYYLSQIMAVLYFLVWQGHVKKTIMMTTGAQDASAS